MVVRKSRTFRYSSTSLALSSRAWASYALMPTPPVGEVGARLAPSCRARSAPGLGCVLVAGPCPVRVVGLVIDHNHEALACWVVASFVGVVGVTKRVVHGVEKPLEHHWVRYAGEVPLGIPVKGCGWQLTSWVVI
jgi:hypothetical protein